MRSTAVETAATKSAEAASVETPEAPAKFAEATPERRRVVDADCETYRHRDTRQHNTGQFLRVRQVIDHRYPPGCYLAADTVLNGIFCVPAGNAGVNTGAAIRGEKAQSVNTALNCGCAGCVL